ncbi:MAG: winged helix-turn-helix domain-containing protein, partial [Clostridia bacterium]
ILSKVWGYEYFGETRTLDMHIKSLRSKIGVFTKKPYIATVRGVGYKFVAIC